VGAPAPEPGASDHAALGLPADLDAAPKPPVQADAPNRAAQSQCDINEDPVVKAKRAELAIAQMDREIQKLHEARDELAWYNSLGRFMFGVVHIVLGVALWMAWLEFDNARHVRAKLAPPKGVAAQKSKGKPKPGDEEETAAPHELKLGLDGIAFKSSLQGTAILAIAFGFYFLYLKFVYPIVLVP